MKLFEDGHSGFSYNYNRMLYTTQDATAATKAWNGAQRAAVTDNWKHTPHASGWMWDWGT